MRLLIAGDILPTEKNRVEFEAGNATELFGEGILDLFDGADLKIANLEGVFLDWGGRRRPIEKSGPAVCTSAEAIRGMLPLHLDAVSLANNHSMDFGEAGLWQTIENLKANGIAYFGAGHNLEEAKIPYCKTLGGKTIGVYACAETEFTIASDSLPGANPFDSLEICDDIARLKEKADYVIVLYHGMKELFRYPAPYVQKRCRKLIDKGADIVLCQHSHCIGCMEKYGGGTIVYGQGDFMFCRGENEFRKDGLLVTVDLPDGSVRYWPVVRHGGIVRLAEVEKEEILRLFLERSENLKKPGFVENEYNKFAEGLLKEYDAASFGMAGCVLRRLHMEALLPALIWKRNDLWQLNVLQCEAHRDVYVCGLKNRIRKKTQ